MSKAYAFIADGTEEVELLAAVDLLRRAGVETVITSVDGMTATSSHGVKITADGLICDFDFSDADLLFIPGGLQGSVRMGGCKELVSAIERQLGAGKRVAAICAAPAEVLGANGFMNGKRGICFPNHESKMKGATVVSGARVVTDGNITTARGLGCAIDLGLELISLLCGGDVASDIKKKIQY